MTVPLESIAAAVKAFFSTKSLGIVQAIQINGVERAIGAYIFGLLLLFVYAVQDAQMSLYSG